jgi:hypothetical protein
MRSVPSPTKTAPTESAALFTLLWDTLAALLGTSATAALLRRAARGAEGRCPELATLSIVREDLDYRYTVPAAIGATGLRELVKELRPLLFEMTGGVVIGHLEQAPGLRALLDEGPP